MARLPLIINDQRLKTLEGLRENFNLTELLARFRGGQLRAWLNCWDFSSELEQVEALSPDLPEQELLELFFLHAPQEPFKISRMSLYSLPELTSCILHHKVPLTGPE